MAPDAPQDDEDRVGGSPELARVIAFPQPARRIEVVGYPGLFLVNIVPPGPHRGLFRRVDTEADAFAYARALQEEHGWSIVQWTPRGEVPA